MRIQIDASRFDHDITAAIEAIRDGAIDGLERSAEIVIGHKRQEQQKTYSRAIPKGKDGRPKWRRSGNWLSGQHVQRTGEFERTVTTEGDAEAYEQHLANLHRSADGVDRRNPASERAAAIFAPQYPHVMEEGINSELRRRGQR